MSKPVRFVQIPISPFWLTLVVARCLPRFKHLSIAMVERMNQDMVFDHSQAAKDIGYAPRRFAPTEQDLPKRRSA
jgi:hypothetical protein